jgi:hypothetical protein
VQDVGTPSQQLVIAANQDWSSDASLVRVMYDNAGDTAVAVFQPDGVNTLFTATVTLVEPDEVGGDVDAFATSTITLPITGKAVPTAPTP